MPPSRRHRSGRGPAVIDTGPAVKPASLALALQMPIAGLRLLDVGCADGEVAQSAERMGAHVTAIDPRPGYVRRARRTAPPDNHVSWRKVGLDGLPDPAGSYDIVLLGNVIDHGRDVWSTVDRAAELTSSHLVLGYGGPDRSTLQKLAGSPAGPLSPERVRLAAGDAVFDLAPMELERRYLHPNGPFERHEIMWSAFADRWISVLSGKRPTSSELIPRHGLGRPRKRRAEHAGRRRESTGRSRTIRSRRSRQLPALLRQRHHLARVRRLLSTATRDRRR